MFRYYLWALTEKTLSYAPFGKNIYSGIGCLTNRHTRGRDPGVLTAARMVREAKRLLSSGGSALEIGTGWHHRDAFALYLIGDHTTYLFDIEDKARVHYIKNYLNYLIENAHSIAQAFDIDSETVRSKLEPLLHLRHREDIYAACKFVPCIQRDPGDPFLPQASIDFMISSCVINHIPPRMLVPELNSLRQMLKVGGRMYHLIGHDDHWAFHDRFANQFTYYQYSDDTYRRFFETKFEYHNRLVKQEWLAVFEQCGLDIEKYDAHITEDSVEQIRKLPRIDARFAKYPLEELATIYSFVLLRRRF